MKSFEEYCRNLDAEEVIFFERRDNQYRSYSNQEIERTRIMQPPVLMKAVAACLLFQPHRAARDYRGILSEYESKLFLDDHDVRVYHAVAYLYYRLEFLWRNQRIANSHKTFRYYILSGIGLRLTEGKDIFVMKKGKVTEIVDAIITLAKNESELKRTVNEIVKILEERLTATSRHTKERMRDSMRSDNFSQMFKDIILGPKKGSSKKVFDTGSA